MLLTGETAIFITLLWLMLFVGVYAGYSSKYIGYDEKKKEWLKGYKMGFRKGKEEAEQKLVEKLKKL